MKSFGVLLVGGADAGIFELVFVVLLLEEVGGTTVDPIQHFFTVSFSVIGDRGAIRTTGIIFYK